MRLTSRVLGLLICLLCATDLAAQRNVPAACRVGVRFIHERDLSRPQLPAADFQGRPAPQPNATPLQIAVWYPSGGTGRRLLELDYRLLATTRDTIRAISARDTAAALASIRLMARFAIGREIPEDDARVALAERARACLGVPPARGRFPTILAATDGALLSVRRIAEQLAGVGYVVIGIASPTSLASVQATRPAVAIEWRVRDLEHILALARRLPYADVTRLGVIGVNFDGMPALLFQMKHMAARAVASIDGWEGKRGSIETVRRSPFFDPARMRAAYFLVLQDEPSAPPPLAHDLSVVESMRYAPRRVIVLEGVAHAHLVGDPYAVPSVPDSARDAYQSIIAVVQSLFDVHVRERPADPVQLASVRRDTTIAALPPIPIAAEVERLVGDSAGIGTLARLQRELRARDPETALLTQQQLRLYTFRLRARGDTAAAAALWEVGVDAHPNWVLARRELATARLALGDTVRAAGAIEGAIPLVERDPTIAADERSRILDELRALLARWRRGG